MSNDYRDSFKQWFDGVFSNTEHRTSMENTSEATKYHREKNVWVHTNMVLAEYDLIYPNEWSKETYLGAIALAFHDTGKPFTEEPGVRPDGTEYRSYKGHEEYSSGLWFDYILSDRSRIEYLDDQDIYNISAMINYHLPYSLNKDRVKQIKTHMDYHGLSETFTSVLVSDCYGRISDDEEARNHRCNSWVAMYRALDTVNVRTKRNDDKTLHLLCGAVAAGKSTLKEILLTSLPNSTSHSMDDIRTDLYGEDYSQAFKESVADNDFNNHVSRDFSAKIKDVTVQNIIIDNTSYTHKSRRKFTLGTKYTTIAYVFFLPYDVQLERMQKRTSKVLPTAVLDKMYYGFKTPLIGEVDAIALNLYSGE